MMLTMVKWDNDADDIDKHARSVTFTHIVTEFCAYD